MDLQDDSAAVGDFAESFVERLCGMAFIEDFVFRSPRFRRGKGEDEVCDVLVIFGETAILFEVKAANRKVHKNWSVEKGVRWANKKFRQGLDQIDKGFRSLVRGIVPSVTNQFQGELNLGSYRLTSFYGVCAVDHPPLEVFGRLDPIRSGAVLCDRMGLSIADLDTMLRELSTLPDFISYMRFRRDFFAGSILQGNTELDLLASFQSRHLSMRSALDSGRQIVLSGDLWNDYSKMSRRRERDIARAPSLLVDRLIREIRACRDYEPPHYKELVDGGGRYRLGSYIIAAKLLNELHRVSRIDIGNHLLRKSTLCDETNRPRHFAYSPLNGWLYLFVVSNEERMQRTQYLSVLVHLAQIRYHVAGCLGVTMNSAGSPTRSIDILVHEVSSSFDWNSIGAEDRELAEQMFQEPKVGASAEYTKRKPPGPTFKHFKKRKA